MSRVQLIRPLARRLTTWAPRHTVRPFSRSAISFQTLPIDISGEGTGTIQTVSIDGKPYKILSDTYPVVGGADSAPSPVVYSLTSLSTCTQVTGSLVARDHNIKLGRWNVSVHGDLPTGALVRGEQVNANWERIALKVRVQTDAYDDAKFQHFVAECERRCPIAQLFKRSGTEWQTEWVNEAL